MESPDEKYYVTCAGFIPRPLSSLSVLHPEKKMLGAKELEIVLKRHILGVWQKWNQ